MDPKTVLNTAQITPLLRCLEGRLTGAIKSGIERLLPLFTEGKARYSDALNALCPGHDLADPGDRKDAFKQFQNLVARFGAIAAPTGLALRSDTFKRNEPADRHCWIEGPAPEASAMADFTAEAVSTLDSLPTLVEPTALLLNPEELENREREKPLIRFFVSYAHDNDELVRRLQDPLEKELRLSKRFRFEVWNDRKIPIGARWHDEIQKALGECHFGLLFLSREFLLSEYINDHELPAFVSGKKPVIPVGLTVLDFARVDLKGVEKTQVFQLRRSGEQPRFFAQCKGTLVEDFVRSLASAIEPRVSAWLEEGKAPATPDRAAKAHPARSASDRAVEPEAGDDDPAQATVELNRTILGNTPQPPCLVAPEGSTGSLKALEQATAQATQNRTLAVKALADWACDPQGTPFCAVLGEVGIGKTTALMMFAREMEQRREADPTVPPVVFIDLKDYELDAGAQLEEILAVVIRRHWKGDAGRRLTPEKVLKALQEKGAILIFDGLDERIIPLPPDKRESFIRQLWRALPPLAQKPRPGVRPGRLVISCRSHYFPSVTALSTAFTGESREGIRENSYTACIILPFRDEQIRAYLRGVLCQPDDSDAQCDAEVEKALGIIQSVHNLSEASTRPFLLSLIAPELTELERMRAAGRTVLGVTLYGLFVDKWLARDAGKHQFTPDHKILLMQAIAAHLARLNQKTLPWEKVARWLDGFLAAHPEIQGRYPGKSAEVLNQDFRTATLVLRPDSESDGFRFAHTSLYEYFLALHLARALEEGHPADWDLPLPSDETLDFFGQLLAEGRKVEPDRVLAAWTALLDDPAAPAQARRVAFRAWLVARDKGWPMPAPKAAQLQGLDLERWRIGGAEGSALDLAGACLEGACLDHAVLTRVRLTGARADGASARLAEWQDVNLAHGSWERANFTGGTARDCDATGLRAGSAVWHDFDAIRFETVGAVLPRDWQREAAVGPCTVPKGFVLTQRHDHHLCVTSVSLSADGTRLATGSYDETVRVWDAASGKHLLSIDAHNGSVLSVAWSPDGNRIASSGEDRTVTVWDVATGTRLVTIKAHRERVPSVVWSPDGTRLASGSDDKTVKVWDAATGRQVLSMEAHNGSVLSVTWSADGARLASASADRTVKVWDAATGNCLLSLDAHMGTVLSVAWSADGTRLASGSHDKTVKVWDTATGRCLLSLCGHTKWVRSVVWSPDGSRIASGSSDNRVKVWDVATGRCLLSLDAHSHWVMSLAWSPDGAFLVSGSYDRTIKVWDAAGGRCLLSLDAHTTWVRSVTWSPDGTHLASGSDDNTVKIWDAAAGRCLLFNDAHKGRVLSVAWSPDGSRLASGSDDNTVKVWDATTGECVVSLVVQSRWALSLAWSPDSKRLVIGCDDGAVRMWDATNGRCLLSIDASLDSVQSVAWSPDGTRLISGGNDDVVKVWDASTGKCLLSLEGHTGWVTSVAWSPDGRRLASGCDHDTVKLWDATTGKCLHSLDVRSRWSLSVVWSPDSTRLASGSDEGMVLVWDAATGTCLRSLDAHRGWITSLAWSPDGTRILSGGTDATIREWDAVSGRLLRTWLTLGRESALLDFPGNRILHASPGAWRHLGWQGWDPVARRRRLLPAEAFGPLPPW